MASSDTLKGYLKSEVSKALGITINTPEFDQIMGAIATAVDRYLKQDIKIDINVEAKGIVDIGNAVDASPTPTPGFVAQTVFDVATKTTTKGNLI